MEYFELRNKLFFPVRRKLINDYQMGTLDFERCEQLVDDLILKIGQYMDTGVPQDESMAIVFAEFQDTIQELRPLTKGYEITCDTNEQFHIPHALYVCVFRDLVGTEFADESYATKFAERDGVKLIFGMPQVPDGLYLDTEQNREIIQKYLAHKTPTTGRSDSIDEAVGGRCTIKSKEELLIEEANALDSLFMGMKIEDISIEIRDNQLVAFDSDGNKWVENEIFDFALNECLTFGADGHLIDGYCVNEELLDQILHYAAQRDVKIERIPL